MKKPVPAAKAEIQENNSNDAADQITLPTEINNVDYTFEKKDHSW